MIKLPDLRQTKGYDCGAIVIQTILDYYGMDVREDKILKLTRTNKKKVTQTRDIERVFKKYGLKTKSGKFTIEEVKKFIDKKIPVILVLQAWAIKKEVDWKKDWKDGHYVIAIGYDKEKMYFDDPATIWKTYLTFDELKKRWHDVGGLKNKGKKYIHFGIVAYGKKRKFSEKKSVHMG